MNHHGTPVNVVLNGELLMNKNCICQRYSSLSIDYLIRSWTNTIHLQLDVSYITNNFSISKNNMCSKIQFVLILYTSNKGLWDIAIQTIHCMGIKCNKTIILSCFMDTNYLHIEYNLIYISLSKKWCSP